MADPKATQADDLDLELARLYDDRVAVPQGRGREGLLGSRASLQSHCSNVFHHAKIWNRLEKSVRASQFTFPGDPMRIAYGYRRNGTRGFVHTLSVTRAPAEAKTLAYTAERIEKDGQFPWEFTAVTDVPLGDSDRHRFVRDTCMLRALNRYLVKASRCGWPSCGRCCNSERRRREVRKLRGNEVPTQDAEGENVSDP